MAKRSGITIAAIVVLSVVLLLGLNMITGPIIKKNAASSSLGELTDVMPEAQGFECIYNADGSVQTALKDIPAGVLAVYKETGDKGYVLKLTTSEGYTKEPMNITMGVGADGKIVGVKVTDYPETKDMGVETYPATYVGQDSALADVQLVAGITYSSSAFKGAVTMGFDALIANELIGAGVKGDDQLLMEQLATLYPGMANAAGVPQYTEVEVAGDHIVKAMANTNECGMAFIVKDGDNTYLALINLSGTCVFYDVNGADVTGSVDPALVDEIKTRSAITTPNESRAIKKLNTMLGLEDAELTAVPVETFTSVTNRYSVEKDGQLMDCLVCHPFGYGNMTMTIYVIIDESGAIYAVSADSFILEPDYFSNYELNEESYKAGFAGLTADTYTDDVALVTGATLTTDAVRCSVRDALDLNAMTGGEPDV